MIVVDGATHSQKGGVKGNGGSLKDVAGVFVLFLHGTQLVMRYSVLTLLDLEEVDVTLKNAEIFGSVLSGEGGSAGCWRCCLGTPCLPQSPPATPKNPSPTNILLLMWSSRHGSNQHSIWTARGESIFVLAV